MNLYAYVRGDSVNRRDPRGLMDEITVTGTPDSCNGCDIGLPPVVIVPVEISELEWDRMWAAAQGEIERVLVDALLDEVVITAKKQGRLANIVIRLSVPREQLWVVIQNMTIIPIPTVDKPVEDSCGNQLVTPVPDSNFQLPPGSRIIATIHTHPAGFAPWPETGDYETANAQGMMSVYGITPSGVWAVRHGTPQNAPPDTLEGPTPTMPAARKAQTCSMRKK